MTEPETSIADINGFATRVWRKGSGPRIGFLAGYGGLPKWVPFLDRLAERRTVIVPSLPGFPGGDRGHTALDTHLDWVLAAHSSRDLPPTEQIRLGLGVNRSFYGWAHRFLWNRALLEKALVAAGFVELRWPAYGESDDPRLVGLEQHETCPDSPGLPHVLVAEGRKGEPRPERLAELRAALEEEVGRFL